MQRYWITDLVINGTPIASNQDPNVALPNADYVSITFNPYKNSVIIDTHGPNSSKHTYEKVKIIRNKETFPTPDNENIGLACPLCVTNDQTNDLTKFAVGPLITRSKKLRSFPGKISCAGGMYDKSDLSCEVTVMRELTEELQLDKYLHPKLIHKMQTNLKLTHLILSHPQVGTSRRFNITFVYAVSLTDTEISQFNTKMYQIEEVDSVCVLKGTELLKSLVDVSPFETDKGWTPNGALIIIDHLIDVAKKHFPNINVKSDGILKLKVEWFSELKIKSSSEKDLNYLLCEVKGLIEKFNKKSDIQDDNVGGGKGVEPIKSNVNYFGQPSSPTELMSFIMAGDTPNQLPQYFVPQTPIIKQSNTREILKPVKNGSSNVLYLDCGWRGGSCYQISRISPKTSAEDVASDFATKFLESDSFVMSFEFGGIKSGSDSKDQNYQAQLNIFHKIIDNMRKYELSVSLERVLTGGNEYYNEGPEHTGYKIICNRK